MNKGTSKSTDEDQQDLGTSIINSALDPYVFRNIGRFLDVTFNKKTFLAIVSEIDVLNKVVKAYGWGVSIHNDLFLNKIVGFLHGCGNITEGERGEFGKRLETDLIYCRRVGENILLILDRLDHYDKTEIIGQVFAGRVRGEIDEGTFFRLASAIDKASIADLRMLETYYSKIESYDIKSQKPFSHTLDDATSQLLYNAGLVRSEGMTENIYRHNETGSCLIRLLRT